MKCKLLSETKSGILLPVEKEPKPPEHPVRDVIRQKLDELRDELGNFECTTHGSRYFHGCSMWDLCALLEECYRDPSAYTISTLRQALMGFKKSEQDSQEDQK